MTYNFTDYKSYSQWKRDWRAAYKELSEEIRELKAGRKTGDSDTRATRQSTLHYRRRNAAEMMKQRTEAKEKWKEMLPSLPPYREAMSAVAA